MLGAADSLLTGIYFSVVGDVLQTFEEQAQGALETYWSNRDGNMEQQEVDLPTLDDGMDCGYDWYVEQETMDVEGETGDRPTSMYGYTRSAMRF